MLGIIFIEHVLLGIIMGEFMWVWCHNVVIHAADHLNYLVDYYSFEVVDLLPFSELCCDW